MKGLKYFQNIPENKRLLYISKKSIFEKIETGRDILAERG